jgi:hypothetical protein
MTRRAVLPVVVAALGALAATAPLASAAGSAVPSAWAAGANAICTKAQKGIPKVSRTASIEEMTKSTQKVLDIVIRQSGELAKLPRPSRDAASIVRLLGYYTQQIAALRGMVAALKKGDQKAWEAQVAKGDAVNTKAITLSRKLGATRC